MLPRLRKRRPPATKTELDILEKAFGRSLPQDYREFLEHSNGGRPVNSYLRWSTPGSALVAEFHSCDEVLKRSAVLRDRLPDDAWAIALTETGDALLLLPRTGDVVHWSHETLEINAVASSFSELAPKLRPATEALPADAAPATFAWINPELLARAKKEEEADEEDN